jgi:hypothetical protein
MSKDILAERKQALEEAFFQKAEKEQVDKYRDKLGKQKTLDELREISGMESEAVLEKLVDAGITGDTMAAIALVPLVHVAWSDGELDKKERAAILQAADHKGIKTDSPAHGLLDKWLDKKPSRELFAAWQSYIGGLGTHLDAKQIAELRDQIVEFAREVARSAGGFLGFGAVSESETRALEQIAAAFPEGSAAGSAAGEAASPEGSSKDEEE